MRNATLGQLKADVSDQADIVGATVRHTPSLLTRLLNQEYQRFQEQVSLQGDTRFLQSVSGTLTVGAASLFQFGLVTAPTATVRTYGLDVFENGRVRSLQCVPFTHRSEYGGPSITGPPVAWSHYQTRSVAIFPPPSSALQYVLWYLPVTPDLSNDADVFDGIAGWEDAITWGVVLRLIVRDQYPTAYQMALNMRDSIWADIKRAATRVTQASNAVVGRDSMGERLSGQYRRRLLPPP